MTEFKREPAQPHRFRRRIGALVCAAGVASPLGGCGIFEADPACGEVIQIDVNTTPSTLFTHEGATYALDVQESMVGEDTVTVQKGSMKGEWDESKPISVTLSYVGGTEIQAGSIVLPESKDKLQLTLDETGHLLQTHCIDS